MARLLYCLSVIGVLLGCCTCAYGQVGTTDCPWLDQAERDDLLRRVDLLYVQVADVRVVSKEWRAFETERKALLQQTRCLAQQVGSASTRVVAILQEQLVRLGAAVTAKEQVGDYPDLAIMLRELLCHYKLQTSQFAPVVAETVLPVIASTQQMIMLLADAEAQEAAYRQAWEDEAARTAQLHVLALAYQILRPVLVEAMRVQLPRGGRPMLTGFAAQVGGAGLLLAPASTWRVGASFLYDAANEVWGLHGEAGGQVGAMLFMPGVVWMNTDESPWALTGSVLYVAAPGVTVGMTLSTGQGPGLRVLLDW